MDLLKASKIVNDLSLPAHVWKLVDVIDLVFVLKKKNRLEEETFIIRIEILKDTFNTYLVAVVPPSAYTSISTYNFLKEIGDKHFTATSPDPYVALEKVLVELKDFLEKYQLID